MKAILVKGTILVASSLFAIAGYANEANKHHANNKHQHWVCETNASAAATDADKKADETMKKGAKNAKAAFEFANRHCRDCTKITCSAEKK